MSKFQRGDRVKARTDTVIGTVIDIYEDRKQAVVYFDGAPCPSNEWIFALEKAPTDDLARLQAENKRLRDALAFYGKYENHERYNPEPRSVIDDDCGQTARKALGGE